MEIVRGTVDSLTFCFRHFIIRYIVVTVLVKLSLHLNFVVRLQQSNVPNPNFVFIILFYCQKLS